MPTPALDHSLTARPDKLLEKLAKLVYVCGMYYYLFYPDELSIGQKKRLNTKATDFAQAGVELN